MKDLQHWQAWHRKCVLSACEPAARDALQSFASKHWRHYANRCSGMIERGNGALTMPTAEVAWHDFEAGLRLRRSRRGKVYKQWLFARIPSHAGDAQRLAAIEGGASLIMRDVVRERFRREMSRRGTFSLNAPVAGSSSEPLTVQDLLPSPISTRDDVYQRDLAVLGAAIARELCCDGLSRRAKIALLAREWGVSSAHPAILRAAACGKSVIYTAYHDALKKIAGTVNRRFREDDRKTRACLAVATWQALIPELQEWAKSENLMTDFF